MFFSISLRVIFNITCLFQCFNRLFWTLQVIFVIFIGFSNVIGFFHFFTCFFFHIKFSILEVYLQYVYRLVSNIQFIFNSLQGFFSITGCFQCFHRLFWTLQVIFIIFYFCRFFQYDKVFFNFTGLFQYHMLFSNFLKVFVLFKC